MKSVAIITARGGSKRIPHKNIKEFCGKPIIAYSIEAAIESECFDEVMVSTDSEEIADVARKYGASVPFMRSEKTSDDYTITADVIEEVLNTYKHMGKEFDCFVCIYPTAPFITSDKLKGAYESLDGADAVISVVEYSFPPQRAFIIDKGLIKYQYPENEKTRTQDLKPIYHDCGQFYFCRVEQFLKNKSLILPNTKPYIISEEESQDIDDYKDWMIAEAKYRLKEEQGV